MFRFETIAKQKERKTMQDQDKSKLARRDFLRVIGLGAGVAAAAASFVANEAVAAELDVGREKDALQCERPGREELLSSQRLQSGPVAGGRACPLP